MPSMGRKSKRTSAPAPQEIPPGETPPVPSLGAQPVPPSAVTSMFGVGAWCPPCPSPPSQSMASSYTPYWPAGVQHPGMAPSLAQRSWCSPSGIGAPTNLASTMDGLGDSDLQAWGSNSHPPGGFVNFLKSAPSPAPAMNNGSASQAIDVSDEDNNGDCIRTKKRLLWKKEEDLRLVGAWLNNSNDPIGSNYKKNDQYWKVVADVYNSTTPKSRARLAKQLKDRFGRIKKKVTWFCAAWKEANSLWASGENDVDLMKRAEQTYEKDHETNGPFMFKHCWEVLRKEPKWDAYLQRLELEPDKRKFDDEEDVDQPFSIDNVSEERPIGGKKAKEQLKKRKNDHANIIDLEDELNKFVDAQKTANERRKEMLETQRRVSSENLEARRLAHLAAKENKESVMLETYRSLLIQDTTSMSEDVRSEHMLALRCLREKLFGKNE